MSLRRTTPALCALAFLTGCGGGDGAAPERPPGARASGPAADLRAPDRLGRLQAVVRGGAFTCATDGRLDVRFAERDGVTVRAGLPLAYARAGARLVARDCVPARSRAPRAPAGGARGILRAADLRCRVPRAVTIELARLGRAATRLLVTDPGTGRLVVAAVLEPERGRLVAARGCRPGSDAGSAPRDDSR